MAPIFLFSLQAVTVKEVTSVNEVFEFHFQSRSPLTQAPATSSLMGKNYSLILDLMFDRSDAPIWIFAFSALRHGALRFTCLSGSFMNFSPFPFVPCFSEYTIPEMVLIKNTIYE